MWILTGNYITFSIAAGVIRLYMPASCNLVCNEGTSQLSIRSEDSSCIGLVKIELFSFIAFKHIDIKDVNFSGNPQQITPEFCVCHW